MCLETCEASRANFGVSASTYTAMRVIENVCIVTAETTRTDFCISTSTNTTTTMIMVNETSCAARPNLLVPTLTYDATAEASIIRTCEAMPSNLLVSFVAKHAARRISEVIDYVLPEAREATRTKFAVPTFAHAAAAIELVNETGRAPIPKLLIPTLTDNTTAELLIESACEAMLPNLLSSPVANNASRRIPQAVNHVREETRETPTSELAISNLTNAATTYVVVRKASKTPASAQLLVSTLADNTATEDLIESTCKAARANLLEPPMTIATPRV